LVVWRGILIDGHNRYEICTRLKLRYKTVDVVLADRARVLIWIEQNQLGRRNLTDWQRAGIAARLLKRLTEQGKKERAQKAGKAGGKYHPKKPSSDTAVVSKLTDRSKKSSAKVSKAAKVSERKVRTVAELEKKLGPDIGTPLSQTLLSLWTSASPTRSGQTGFAAHPFIGAEIEKRSWQCAGGDRAGR
jgi:hypothetical protein